MVVIRVVEVVVIGVVEVVVLVEIGFGVLPVSVLLLPDVVVLTDVVLLPVVAMLPGVVVLPDVLFEPVAGLLMNAMPSGVASQSCKITKGIIKLFYLYTETKIFPSFGNFTQVVSDKANISIKFYEFH